MKLLLRLANDLRCTQLVVVRGYPLQAAALVASMYEVAFTVAYIGNDDQRARAWAEHNDPTKPLRDAWSMTRAVVVKLGLPNPDAQTADFFRVYRQLCLAKHSNPILESQIGTAVQSGTTVLPNGPDTSEAAVRAAWFALHHAVGLTLVALDDFYRSHVREHCEPSGRAALEDFLGAVGDGRKELREAATDRWGSEDPFAGRW